jgi:phage terminase large subunit
MNYKYTTTLKKIRSLKKKIRAIVGGTSAGKTISILMVLIDKCIKTPKLEVSVVGESIPSLRRGALKDWEKIMKDTNRWIEGNFNKSTLKYTFTNGSYIEFFSVDDETRIRGARRDCLFVNEANNISYDAYLQLSIRTIGHQYLDWNPSHKFWYYTELQGRDDVEEITLTYKDNEALSPEIVKQLESYREKALTSTYWSNWVATYLDGLLGKTEGNIYQDYNVIDIIPEEAKTICYALDFGYSQDPSALVHILKYNDEIIVDEVIYQKGLLNSDISNIMKTYGVKGEIFADSSEPKSIQEIKRHGFNIRGVEKGRDSVVFGIQLVQQQKLNITRRSKNILDELDNYTWKKSRDGGYDNTPIDNFNHALDALRYGIVSKLGSRKYSGSVPSVKFGSF